jgi:predicted Ser/Thr protein kinase
MSTSSPRPCSIPWRRGSKSQAKRPCIAGEIGNSKDGKKFYARPRHMLKVKDTLRATVHLSFDGRVVKAYHGPDAEKRFANEVRVLRHLEAHGCNFTPRLLAADEKNLRIITTNCGGRVEHIDSRRTQELFAELEKYGVRHDDADPRNITYRFSDGRFCLIDFEFATILSPSKNTPT